MAPIWTNILYRAEHIDLDPTEFELRETQATQIAWIYGCPRNKVDNIHVAHTCLPDPCHHRMIAIRGTAYNGATKDTNDLSFARSDNHVIPNKNEICKMDGGMANKFVSNVEKPNS